MFGRLGFVALHVPSGPGSKDPVWGALRAIRLGTKAVVDFMRNDEKKVTVAHMHPSGGKLLIMRGLLTGSDGWEKDNP